MGRNKRSSKRIKVFNPTEEAGTMDTLTTNQTGFKVTMPKKNFPESAQVNSPHWGSGESN